MPDQTIPAFVAVYGGADITHARLLAASSDRDLVEQVASKLLDRWPADSPDPIESALKSGRRAALRLVVGGSNE